MQDVKKPSSARGKGDAEVQKVKETQGFGVKQTQKCKGERRPRGAMGKADLEGEGRLRGAKDKGDTELQGMKGTQSCKE